jgi:hypothetical protein
MPQINVTLSDEVADSLTEMSRLTGLTKSGLMAEYVRRGLHEDAEKEARMMEFKTLAKKIRGNKSDGKPSNGKKAYILLAEKAKGKILTAEEARFIIQALPEYDYTESDLI